MDRNRRFPEECYRDRILNKHWGRTAMEEYWDRIFMESPKSMVESSSLIFVVECKDLLGLEWVLASGHSDYDLKVHSQSL